MSSASPVLGWTHRHHPELCELLLCGLIRMGDPLLVEAENVGIGVGTHLVAHALEHRRAPLKFRGQLLEDGLKASP